MSNLFVRATKEVCLATNFWKASGASTFINDAMVELSKRAGERGTRVVVKLMYDRGSLKQVSCVTYRLANGGFKLIDVAGPEQPPGCLSKGMAGCWCWPAPA